MVEQMLAPYLQESTKGIPVCATGFASGHPFQASVGSHYRLAASCVRIQIHIRRQGVIRIQR